MQFRVPQFIDVEDKVFGPFTFKQFIYLIGGAGGMFAVYRILPIYLALPAMFAIGGFAAALTFYKINGRPFLNTFIAFIIFHTGKRFYIWEKNYAKKKKKTEEAQTAKAKNVIPTVTGSRLKDLAWSLDVIENNPTVHKSQ